MKFLIDLFYYHLQLLSHYLSASFQDSVFDILLVVQKGEGFSCLKDRMLEKFQPIQIAKRFYWLNAFLSHKIEVNINRKSFKSVENNQKYYKLWVTTAKLFR